LEYTDISHHQSLGSGVAGNVVSKDDLRVAANNHKKILINWTAEIDWVHTILSHAGAIERR
jgi:hypothetical protein